MKDEEFRNLVLRHLVAISIVNSINFALLINVFLLQMK